MIRHIILSLLFFGTSLANAASLADNQPNVLLKKTQDLLENVVEINLKMLKKSLGCRPSKTCKEFFKTDEYLLVKKKKQHFKNFKKLIDNGCVKSAYVYAACGFAGEDRSSLDDIFFRQARMCMNTYLEDFYLNLGESDLCTSCFNQAPNILYYKCGHATQCEQCVGKSVGGNCPACNQESGTIKINLENMKLPCIRCGDVINFDHINSGVNLLCEKCMKD